MMISNFPSDLVEEILSRVPLGSLKAMRSTCKKWNALTKDRRFTNKHMANIAASREKEYLMVVGSKVHLVGVDLHRNQNNIDLSVNLKGQLSSVDNLDELFHKSQIFLCNGSLLCVSKTSFVVWSPYWGEPKWIKRSYKYGRTEKFAFGYDKSCGSHNILRLYGNYLNNVVIYDLNSDSWIVPNVTLERDVVTIEQSVSLNGNTYWYASDKESSSDYYLFCFDFTRKRFGPRLTLPFVNKRNVSIAAVKEDQLAVLSKGYNGSKMELWVTDKLEPDSVSWRHFLTIDLTLRLSSQNFLIDEENKLAVVFAKEGSRNSKTIFNNIAYVIGENDYLRKVVLDEFPWPSYLRLSCYRFPSYVPIK